MANLDGMKMKFTVIKNEDLDSAYLMYPALSRDFELLQTKIKRHREYEGKKENTYLVINTDEPYADEVIEILKRHGHWG